MKKNIGLFIGMLVFVGSVAHADDCNLSIRQERSWAIPDDVLQQGSYPAQSWEECFAMAVSEAKKWHQWDEYVHWQLGDWSTATITWGMVNAKTSTEYPQKGDVRLAE